MNRLRSRIQRLEHKSGLSLPLINLFAMFSDSSPVLGYRITGMDIPDGLYVGRIEGEMEEELQNRVIEVANAIPNRRHPLIFIQMLR